MSRVIHGKGFGPHYAVRLSWTARILTHRSDHEPYPLPMSATSKIALTRFRPKPAVEAHGTEPELAHPPAPLCQELGNYFARPPNLRCG